MHSLINIYSQFTLYVLIFDRRWKMRSKREVPRDVQNSKVRTKTSSGEIGLDIRTHASPKAGHDQVS